MSITFDSFDFSPLTGYTPIEDTPGDIVTSGSGATLDTGVFATAALRTPMMDASSWPAINKVVATCTEGLDNGALFYLRFLLSFDNWNSEGIKRYMAYLPGVGWYQVASSETGNSDLFSTLRTRGLQAEDLAMIREFPPGTANISVLVGMTRETNGGDGEIEQIDVYHGTDDIEVFTPEVSIGTGFPVGDSGAPLEPDMPFNVSFSQPMNSFSFIGGYEQIIEAGLQMRQSVSLQWTGLIEDDKDTLVEFLKDAMATHFTWAWNGLAASLKWKVVGMPQVTQGGRMGIYNVACSIEEFFQ